MIDYYNVQYFIIKLKLFDFVFSFLFYIKTFVCKKYIFPKC